MRVTLALATFLKILRLRKKQNKAKNKTQAKTKHINELKHSVHLPFPPEG